MKIDISQIDLFVLLINHKLFDLFQWHFIWFVIFFNIYYIAPAAQGLLYMRCLGTYPLMFK